MRFLLGDRC